MTVYLKIKILCLKMNIEIMQNNCKQIQLSGKSSSINFMIKVVIEILFNITIITSIMPSIYNGNKIIILILSFKHQKDKI